MPAPVSVAFEGDLTSPGWSGPASGIGPVFDFPIPTGPSFSTFEAQLLAAHSVSVTVAGHFWIADLVGAPEAYAMMQDCVVSVMISDGRW